MKLTRRDFLKSSTLGAGLALLAQQVEATNLTRQPLGWRGRERVREIASLCEMCFWRCGIRGNVDEYGRLIKIDGNPFHPLTEGRLCARGNAGHKLTYDPDRLKYPLKRIGERGEGKFKRISWEEALDTIAEHLLKIKEAYGPEAVGYFPHGIHARFFSQLMDAYGTPNAAEPAFAQCRGPRDVGYKLTFGQNVGSPEPLDFENTKMMVFIGTHIGENVFTGQILEFAQALERGAKLLVVDPRYSTAASKADWWLPIKPGTDTALILAWIHVLITEELYDKDYVRKYTTGFAQLKKHVREYTPEWAEKITEIPAAVIYETARQMGQYKPHVGVHPGRHFTWYGNDSQRARAMAILTAILGAYGRPGGIYLPSRVPALKYPAPHAWPQAPRADGAGTLYPFASRSLGVTNGLIDATLSEKPYPIKAWIVYGQNVIQSIPDPYSTIEAIRKLDFMLVIDVMPTEPTLFADIVLPEATYLERHDDLLTVSNAKTPFAAIRQPVIDPLFESKPGWWITKELAKRLGLEEYFPWENIEEYLDYRLSGLGTSLAEVRAKGIVVYPKSKPFIEPGENYRFKTPSGKIELYSTQLEKMGFDPIPTYEPPDEVPKGYFRLLYGRSPIHSFARSQNNEILHAYQSENAVWVNNQMAAQMNLKDGDYVILENQDGVKSNPIQVRITPGIRPDSVYMVHGFGQQSPLMQKAFLKGTSDTFLMTRFKVDPLSGATGMRVNFVRFLKDGKPLMASAAPGTLNLRTNRANNQPQSPPPPKPVPQMEEVEEEEGC